MKIGFQLYLRDSAKAVALYQRAFGATLGHHVYSPDGTFMHAELYVDGTLLLAVSEANNTHAQQDMARYSATTYPAMNFCVTLESEQAVRHAYAALAEGANILYPLGPLPWSACCANVVDRFGVFWYLTV
ncbi:VOC family protein [Chloroflexia bacterium SDU3-3]|nr:VOC family protein [Chloroflexia bacterium SDU3-3]